MKNGSLYFTMRVVVGLCAGFLSIIPNAVAQPPVKSGEHPVVSDPDTATDLLWNTKYVMDNGLLLRGDFYTPLTFDRFFNAHSFEISDDPPPLNRIALASQHPETLGDQTKSGKNDISTFSMSAIGQRSQGAVISDGWLRFLFLEHGPNLAELMQVFGPLSEAPPGQAASSNGDKIFNRQFQGQFFKCDIGVWLKPDGTLDELSVRETPLP
jgi:hypothetical protein